MNKDNLIFAVIGILVGFIAGYLMHEVVASKQPPRLTPELRAQEERLRQKMESAR